jgi:hypothetical protein
MTHKPKPPLSPYERAWWGVFFTTIVAGPAILAVLWIIASVNGRGLIHRGNAVIVGLIVATLVMIPIGAFSATVCAGIIRHRSVKHTLPLFLLLTVVAGVVSAPFMVLFFPATLVLGPVMIVVAQVLASFVALSLKPDPRLVALERADACANCLYLLTGLDRTRTIVCPECGAGLPPLPLGEGGDAPGVAG